MGLQPQRNGLQPLLIREFNPPITFFGWMDLVHHSHQLPVHCAFVLRPGLVDTSLGPSSAALGAIDLQIGSPVSTQNAAAGFGGKLSPREAAKSAIAAIEADRVHVAPGGHVAERAQARVTVLLADIAAG
ncbi:hypothetical protein [Streptomyces ipomoeae]|uniref:hypothetical protein n=1 Tax=Streptomyces ipomoeae TaxID=103232 RepID=UPI0011472199|nr:hypothetical protein [Streptomyces ipomoeae]MDX2939569.1 hypothetical protein [Streptomyces ipomoeae]TQE20061.1 hypothetical protein SipoB123_29875 [Streptomyces ipomoeae]